MTKLFFVQYACIFNINKYQLKAYHMYVPHALVLIKKMTKYKKIVNKPTLRLFKCKTLNLQSYLLIYTM